MVEHSSPLTPSQITKEEEKRGRKRLLFLRVHGRRSRMRSSVSEWAWLALARFLLLLGSHVRRWNAGWSMWSSCFGFVAGASDSSQKRSASNTWSGQVSPFWPLGALGLRAGWGWESTILHLQVSGMKRMNISPESPSIIAHRAREGTGKRSNPATWQLHPSHLSVTYSSSRASVSTYPIIWVMSCQKQTKKMASQRSESGRTAPPQMRGVRDCSVQPFDSFDKRNKIIGECKWTRCQLCSGAGHPHQNRTQMEPDIIVVGAPPVLSSQQCEIRKRESLLLHPMPKSSNCFVWTKIKRRHHTRNATFSGSTPQLHNTWFKQKKTIEMEDSSFVSLEFKTVNQQSQILEIPFK